MAIASSRQTVSSASANASRSGPVAIGAPPAAPLARTMTASLVEVSPSIVTWLKVRSTAGRRSSASACDAIGASVVRKASMVAICGWIMPAPFAMPPMRISRPSSSRAVTACSLGRVSVVMIARAASVPAPSVRRSSSVGIVATMAATGSREPMRPVDAGSTSSGAQPRCCAAAATTARASSSPPGPVPAFAQPAFTTIARADPPLAWSASSATRTGAARRRFVVNVAAAAPAWSEAMITRSGAARLADAGLADADREAAGEGHAHG